MPRAESQQHLSLPRATTTTYQMPLLRSQTWMPSSFSRNGRYAHDSILGIFSPGIIIIGRRWRRMRAIWRFILILGNSSMRFDIWASLSRICAIEPSGGMAGRFAEIDFALCRDLINKDCISFIFEIRGYGTWIIHFIAIPPCRRRQATRARSGLILVSDIIWLRVIMLLIFVDFYPVTCLTSAKCRQKLHLFSASLLLLLNEWQNAQLPRSNVPPPSAYLPL